ncbi:hypothetical protein RUM43_004312 [Polyplax serrata]|uniref:Ion transport domain-containing protein n=1 Tax=Polyplax serrata TaxID=468196 RepID=A0AAN8SAR1_POLSC
MYLFGGKFCMLSDGSRECTCIEISLKDPDCVCDRKHFNNFLWATVTVFQILTQEDWNVVLFNGMEKTSHWAALYFVALMTFGNYVLFNLLVAILVEGFSSERNERREREARELEKQREKAAEIAAALFEEAVRYSPTSDSSETSFHHDIKNKWRSAEDIHQPKYRKSKVQAKESLWKLKQNMSRKQEIKCNNVRKESQMLEEVPIPPPSPPRITHTAATPQDSPNATTDLSKKESIHKIRSHEAFFSSGASIESIDSSNSSQWSIPQLLKPSNNYKLANNNLSNSSQTSLGKCITTVSIKDTIPQHTPRRVYSWRLSRPSLKRKSRRNSGTSELRGNDGETILNNNHLSTRSSEEHIRCNGNLLSSNTIRNDTQSHKSFSPQHSIKSKHSGKDVQVGWSDSNSINQGSSKKDNLEHAASVNEIRMNGAGITQNEHFQSKSSKVNVSPTSIPPSDDLLKTKQNEDFIAENVEVVDNVDSTTPCTADAVPKVFYCFEKTGCFKEREDYSLYIFPPDNKFRKSCTWVVERKWFDNAVLLFIGLNCITLAMERPNIPPNSTERLFLLCANYVFTVVFALEMFVKVIATGMWYGKNAYFTSGWNIMDGALVTISIVDLLMSLISESSPRIFGILRLFKGTFYYCEGPKLENVKNKTDCLADSKNQWLNRKYNFDDLGKALMSLFVLSSRDGWVNIMYTGLDAVGVDLQPVKNYSEWRLLYFIAFILLVGFFVLNMFVGVVVENFHRCREEQEKEERMIRLAKRAKQMEKKRRKMHEPPYYINYSKPRLVIHNVVTSKYFDLAIAAVIGLNVVTMAMEFYMMPRLLALGLKLYLKDRWNQLDVAIVFLSIVGIVLEELESKIIPINPTIIRVMRVLRIARVLKLLKMAKGIRALLDTVMQALPQVGNLGLLFFLLFFIFAALGVELFGRLECSDEMPCQGLGEHAHFANFGMAFLTLFRVATGDNWNGIMKDTLRDNCDDNTDCVKNCCVSTIIAPIFFVIFVLMAQFVLVNVVVAVLMKHLEESHKQMEDELDMEVELERELQQEQEELEEEMCLRSLEVENDSKGRVKRPLGKVLSLPSNFIYHSEANKNDSSFQIDDTINRRGSSISYHLPYHSHRRQTFHSQVPLTSKPFALPAFASIYTTDQEKLLNKNIKGNNKIENVIDHQALLRRMSSIDYKRRSSVSAGNSRRGSLFKPRTELQALIGLSKSAGLMSCPTPQQLLSLTELVIDEKEREKRILRKALSMENRTTSEENAPEGISASVLIVPPAYPCDKMLLRPPEDDKFKKSERRPLFRQQKSTEAMEKIEEGFVEQNVSVQPKVVTEKRKMNFRQMSLDSKCSTLHDKTKEIHPEEIAMVVHERRSPYLRELRGQLQDFSLDETPFIHQGNQSKTLVRRQLTTPILEGSPLRRRKPSLLRQECQEVTSTESLTKCAPRDNLPLSLLEKRESQLRKPQQSSGDDVATAETSLSVAELLPNTKKENEQERTKMTPRQPKKETLLEVSAGTSTSSNSTTATNIRSDSLLSEEADKESRTQIKLVESEDGSKAEFEVVGKQKNEKKITTGSKERLIGTSSEECCDTSEDDACQKPSEKY